MIARIISRQLDVKKLSNTKETAVVYGNNKLYSANEIGSYGV